MRAILAVFFILTSVSAQAKSPWGSRHLVLALDGLPYDTFKKAQNENGLFTDFKAPSRMVAPYPALSAYAWAQIFDQPKIDYYQAMYYDWNKNKVVGSAITEAHELIIEDHFSYMNDSLVHHLKSYMTANGPLEKELKVSSSFFKS